MMRNFNSVVLILFLSAHECFNVSQQPQVQTNNTGDTGIPTPFDARTSLHLIENNGINIITKSHRRRYSLYPLMEGTIFLATYHNSIDSVIKLISYWKMENAAFLVDAHTGISATNIRAYLKMHLTNVKFEVAFLDSKLDFNKTLMMTLELSFTNFATICNERNTNEIINVVKLNNLLNTNHRWIFVSQRFPRMLQNTIISVESQVTLISPQTPSEVSIDISTSQEFIFYDVFYSYQTRNVEFVKFAHWSVQKGLIILENLESKDLTLRLRGRRIKLGAFIHLPYINITHVNGSVYFGGYNVEIMEMLLEYFNANYSLNQYPQSWGVFLNGTYTGLLGVVYRKEIDVPVNGFMQATFRSKASRFLFPLSKLDLSLGYTTPSSAISPATHMFPFRTEVWGCIAIGLVLMLFTLAIAMHFSPGWKSAQIPSIKYHSDTFRLVTGTFIEEALIEPPGSSAKVIYGTLLLATLAVFVFYTSVFTSFLAYRELKMPIRNMRDLVETREYSAVTVANSVYEGMFRLAQDGIFREMWKKMENSGIKILLPGITQAVNSMYSAKRVLLADSASIIAGANYNCSISVIKTRLLREHLCMVTRNDFPYSRMIYMRLLHMTEGGIFKHFGKKYMTESRPPCDEPEPSLTLGLLQVVGLFFLLSCGVLLALVTLLVEKIGNVPRWVHPSTRK